ncbi:MAG TPA: NADH-quinone oxidoreductase subunit N [Bacteroidia bacterium]|nr:NADH-quinone oxidoreductase subunit N [Bacteroidia bacterium]
MSFDNLIIMKSELLLLAVLFIILFMKILEKPDVSGTTTDHSGFLNVVNCLLLLNFIAGWFMNGEGRLFGDMFHSSPLLHFEKNVLNLGTLIISLQATEWLRHHKHVYEFYMLLLSTLLGMFFMISTDNLMMFYLGLELSTIPLAALANFDLDKKRSSEAAMKMIMLSAFSSGVLLFGISMLYGTTGTMSLYELPFLLDGSGLQLFALVTIFAGFGFKISAVPFHLWTADVYEGAPASVTAYLSVISKGAILFVMLPVIYNAFQPLHAYSYRILVLLAIATMVVGNLFALRQTNLKRLLAFSSIAQIGFILVGMSGQSVEGSVSVIYFVLIYLFSNLGAFGVITLVSALTGKESIADYKGFHSTNPGLSWVLAIALFSLAGIPPVAGFFGKFFLLFSGAGQSNYTLVIIAALNMIVSLYYYLKVIKALFMDKGDAPIPPLQVSLFPKAALTLCIIGMLTAGLYGDVYGYIYNLIALR